MTTWFIACLMLCAIWRHEYMYPTRRRVPSRKGRAIWATLVVVSLFVVSLLVEIVVNATLHT